MKLFRIDVERTIFVVAESERDAYLDAHMHEREAMSDYDADDVCVTEITSLDQIPSEWRDALPYGSDDFDSRKTIDYLREEAAPFVDTQTLDMFAP